MSTSTRFDLQILHVFKKRTYRKASFSFFFTGKVSKVIYTERGLSPLPIAKR